MRSRRNLFRVVIGVFAWGAATAFAKEPATIRVELQVIAVPAKEVPRLIPELAQRDRFAAAYAGLQDLVARGEAKVLAWPFVETQEGVRGTSQMAVEVRYPAAFDGPTLQSVRDVGTVRNVDREHPLRVKAAPPKTIAKATAFGFETRVTGFILDVDAALSEDGKWILLRRYLAENSRLKANHEVSMEWSATGKKVLVEQPEFARTKTETQFSVKNGERTLAGVFPSTAQPGFFEVHILTASSGND